MGKFKISVTERIDDRRRDPAASSECGTCDATCETICPCCCPCALCPPCCAGVTADASGASSRDPEPRGDAASRMSPLTDV